MQNGRLLVDHYKPTVLNWGFMDNIVTSVINRQKWEADDGRLIIAIHLSNDKWAHA